MNLFLYVEREKERVRLREMRRRARASEKPFHRIFLVKKPMYMFYRFKPLPKHAYHKNPVPVMIRNK